MQGSPRIDELRQKFHENPRRYFAPLANEYRKAGDPEQAIAICRAHLAQQPGHMSGHVVYGQALFDARRPEEARTVFEKALSLDPDNTIVLRQLGDIAREKGDTTEARHWYSKALDIDPGDSETAAYVAELTEPLTGEETVSAPGTEVDAKPDEAVVEVDSADDVPWRKTPRPEESPFVTKTMAELYASQGYNDAALDVYRQLAIHHPEDSDIRDRIAALSGESAPSAEPVAEPAAGSVEAGLPETFVEDAPAPHAEERTYADSDFVIETTDGFGSSELGESPLHHSSDDMHVATPDESEGFSGGHFTEMELSDRAADGTIELDESPFGDLAWEAEAVPPADEATVQPPEVVESPVEELTVEEPVVDEPAGEEPVVGEPAVETPVVDEPAVEEPVVDEPAVEEPVVDEPAVEEPVVDEPAVEEPVVDEPRIEEPVIEDSVAEEVGAGEPATEARFVEMPVALGDVQTSIDEAGMAATSPHDADFPIAAEEPVSTDGIPAGEDEAAAVMLDEAESPVTWAEDENAMVAYSPEPPRDEDLPHFTPRVPTVREFFATLGSRRPPSRDAGPPITAHAANHGAQAAEPVVEELPLASDAFSTLFSDAPVSEEDTRAAFALSGAMSATGHNPNPSSLRTSPPAPAPAVDAEVAEQSRESEEDIRRFREWLDGLADS